MTESEKKMLVEARRAYQKNWRAKNKGKVRQSMERYWLKKATQMKTEQDRDQSDSSHADQNGQ